MTTSPVTPQDFQRLADQYGSEQFTAGAASHDADITALRGQLAAEQAAHAADKAALAAALERLSEITHADPVKLLPFGIGINEKATPAASPLPFTRAKLEADAGVRFTFAHEYFRFTATGVLTAAVTFVETHMKAGRVPVLAIKVPGDDWAGTAAGKYDAAVHATLDAIEALATKYGVRAIVAVHHEPNNGDGTWADFKAMTMHLSPLIRRPGKVEFWVCFTGYANLFGSKTDDWYLDDDVVIPGVDGYGFDPYLSLGASSTKLTDMVTSYAAPLGAWADKHGVQWGIWETGLNENAAKSTIAGVKTWIGDFAAGCAEHGATMWIYWNNQVDASRQDWRITTTAPADKHAQLLAAMRRWAPKPTA